MVYSYYTTYIDNEMEKYTQQLNQQLVPQLVPQQDQNSPIVVPLFPAETNFLSSPTTTTTHPISTTFYNCFKTLPHSSSSNHQLNLTTSLLPLSPYFHYHSLPHNQSSPHPNHLFLPYINKPTTNRYSSDFLIQVVCLLIYKQPAKSCAYEL